MSQRKLDELFEQIVLSDSKMSQRECLVILTISTMFLGGLTQSPENKIGAQAMLLHLVLIQNTKLLDRGIRAQGYQDLQFFDAFVKIARVHLSSIVWTKAMREQKLPCNISDFLDGTLFFAVHMVVAEHGIDKALLPATFLAFNTLASSVDHLCGTNLQSTAVKTRADATGVLGGPSKERNQSKEPSNQAQGAPLRNLGKVLPFSNDALDDHLKSVHVPIDESVDSKNIKGHPKELREEGHWHISKPLEEKGKTIMSPKEVERYRRKTQFFMSEMEDYAASLTGPTGNSHPESIFVDSTHNGNGKSHQKPTWKNNHLGGDVAKSSKGTKKGQAKVGQTNIRELAAASIQQKAAETTRKQRQKWKLMYQEEFARIRDIETRFTKLNIYLSSLSKDSRRILEPEVPACQIDTLMRLVYIERGGTQAERHTFLATRIWEIITRLGKLKEGISPAIVAFIDTVCALIGLPVVHIVHQDIQCHEPLSFQPFKPPAGLNLKIGMSPVEFQLSHGGHCMERSIDSMPDLRTPDFDPDRWQRDVLDQIDLKNGLFIVAPTSAGKTFIS